MVNSEYAEKLVKLLKDDSKENIQIAMYFIAIATDERLSSKIRNAADKMSKWYNQGEWEKDIDNFLKEMKGK